MKRARRQRRRQKDPQEHWGHPGAARLVDQVAEFRVYPHGMAESYRPASVTPDLHWVARVFRTKEAMIAFYRWRSGVDDGDFGARVVNTLQLRYGRGPTKLRPRLGEVLFYVDRVGTSIISHEALHVAASTLRAAAAVEDLDHDHYLDLGIDNDDGEERFAYLLGEIARQIAVGLHERQL